MLTRFLHKFVSHPAVYDLAQMLAGGNLVHARLAALARPFHDAARVLDIGGGTGLLRKLFNRRTQYICLDIELPKLQGFITKATEGLPLLADATRCPLADQCVDVVTCSFVCHHLDDVQLSQVLAEASRVLRPGGHLLLVDAILAPARPIGRLLWRLDRGSHPRTARQLLATVADHFDIQTTTSLAVWHEYLFVTAKTSA